MVVAGQPAAHGLSAARSPRSSVARLSSRVMSILSIAELGYIIAAITGGLGLLAADEFRFAALSSARGAFAAALT